MWVLGIAGSHNGAVALLHDGKVVSALQAERLTRFKRQKLQLGCLGANLTELTRACLREAGIGVESIELVATSTPWADDQARLGRWFEEARQPRVLSVPHHLAHAEYALHYSPLEPSLILVVDGSGTSEAQRAHLDLRELESDAIKHLHGVAKESISAYSFDGRDISLRYRFAGDVARQRLLDDRPFINSLGHLWRWAAQYCCADPHEAGKVMGLAAFGDPARHRGERWLNFDERSGALDIFFEALAAHRQPNADGRDVTGEPHYADLAAHLQATTSDFLLRLVSFLTDRWAYPHLCYAGGVALNGLSNERIIRSGRHDVHMNGSCEDNGTAIGAALAAYHHVTGKRVGEAVNEFYGPAYSDAEVDAALAARQLTSRRAPMAEVMRSTAAALAQGKVVAWFQGRSEFGPRALGNRSILADPRNPAMQDILNLKVKVRERYRPYAPAVLEERAHEFFDLTGSSPSMLRVAQVKVSALPAITHSDGSARVQTVSREHNPVFYSLIQSFGELTGVPVLLNTSFNRAGQPIVETPADAIDAFLAMRMDRLVIFDRVVEREGGFAAAAAPALAKRGTAASSDVLPDTRYVLPHALRHQVWSAPEDGRDIIFVYGREGVVQLEGSALPIVLKLCEQRQFSARDVLDWGEGLGLGWAEVHAFVALLEGSGLSSRLVADERSRIAP